MSSDKNIKSKDLTPNFCRNGRENGKMSNLQTIILAISLILAGLFIGGIYEIRSIHGQVAFKINKFTGTIWGCRVVPMVETFECVKIE